MRIFKSLDELASELGNELVVSDWMLIDQQRINLFADATNDHQWIHLDPEKAKAGPFGVPIAHGFLTLSLLPCLIESAMAIEGQKMGVNYGLNKVRFPAPVPVQSELRARIILEGFERLGEDGAQCVMGVTIERRGADKPVCVAQAVTRHYV